MRRAARRDDSEPEIIEALEAAGFTVQQLTLPVDLLLARRGWTGVAEVKTGKGKLKPSQVKFIDRWPNPVYILRSVEDVLALVKQAADC